ncbi:MAG: hypothetical protein LBR80_03685 [Deltaproteobacteria bacterium]|jgi:hypothetical protein|nr:hypothetical protein [Deltaproteobacteria bacterium]
MDLMDITSVNSTAFCTIDEVFPAGFALEGYSTDAAIDTDNVTLIEYRFGVDGKLSVGYINSEKVVNLHLEANSPSTAYLFEAVAWMRLRKRPCRLTLVVTLPSVNQVYTYKDGAIVDSKLMPDVKKTLEPSDWKLIFAELERSAL